MSLLGKKVILFCVNYIYAGDLIGVNETCVKLENAGIIYETGNFQNKTWKDHQSLPAPIWYVQRAAIESFAENTK